MSGNWYASPPPPPPKKKKKKKKKNLYLCYYRFFWSTLPPGWILLDWSWFPLATSHMPSQSVSITCVIFSPSVISYYRLVVYLLWLHIPWTSELLLFDIFPGLFCVSLSSCPVFGQFFGGRRLARDIETVTSNFPFRMCHRTKLYRVSHKKWNSGFSVACDLKVPYLFTSSNQATPAEENDTKIIKFDWVILILWPIVKTQ